MADDNEDEQFDPVRRFVRRSDVEQVFFLFSRFSEL